MGIQERRQREIAAQIKNTLQAARDLARREGWPKVSIRKIANAIEYTPPVIYEHFESREAILVELEKQGFEQLKQQLEEAHAREQEAEHQLMAMSLAYWRFAFSQHDLYQVMFNLEGNQTATYSLQSMREAGEVVTSTLKALNPFPTKTDSLFFGWWSMLHGFVSLRMCGQVPVSQLKWEQHLEENVKRFIQSIQ